MIFLWQAELLDAAAGVFIRFRLGGVGAEERNTLNITQQLCEYDNTDIPAYILLIPLPSDYLSPQHLLQDLHPSTHRRHVCQQPEGLHPAWPKEACGPADQQLLASYTRGPIKMVPAQGEQRLEALL